MFMVECSFVKLTLQISAKWLTYDNFQNSIFNFQFY